jgi:hypothetical protein
MKTMNKLMSFFLLMLCLSNPVFGIEDCCEKVGFETTSIVSHIITNEEGVFLRIGNSWIATEAL